MKTETMEGRIQVANIRTGPEHTNGKMGRVKSERCKIQIQMLCNVGRLQIKREGG